MPVFETARIVVRELDIADAADLHTICGDAEVMKFVGNLQPYTFPQTKQAILKCLKSYGWNGWGGWALCDKDNASLFGYGGFEWVEERSMPELFYIFNAEHWGKGFASEFAKAAVMYAKTELKLNQLGTSFDPANKASMRVASKVGFTFSHEGLDEFNLPTIYYSLKLNDLAID